MQEGGRRMVWRKARVEIGNSGSVSSTSIPKVTAMNWPFGKAETGAIGTLWRGQDPAFFMRVVRALRKADIPHERTRARGYEAMPPALSGWALFPLPVFEIRVHLPHLAQARGILRQL